MYARGINNGERQAYARSRDAPRLAPPIQCYRFLMNTNTSSRADPDVSARQALLFSILTYEHVMLNIRCATTAACSGCSGSAEHNNGTDRYRWRIPHQFGFTGVLRSSHCAEC
jgi:hypothetical protein